MLLTTDELVVLVLSSSGSLSVASSISRLSSSSFSTTIDPYLFFRVCTSSGRYKILDWKCKYATIYLLSDKQICRQISTIFFSNALVETSLIKLGDGTLYVLFGSYRKTERLQLLAQCCFQTQQVLLSRQSTAVFDP